METKAGKSSLPHDHPLNMGSVGVTGTSASQPAAEQADVVLAVGSRLQDFTTGSWALFKADSVKIVGLNVQPFDAHKHRALPLVADARSGLDAARRALGAWQRRATRGQATAKAAQGRIGWAAAKAVTDPTNAAALRRAGDRRRAPGPRLERCRWSAPPAACRANCTSCGRPVRRAATTWNMAIRPWATRSPAGWASSWRKPDDDVDRHARRRQLHDDEFRDRELGHAGQEADHRGARQSRLWLHQPAADGDRRRQLQQSAEGRAHEVDARDRFRRACGSDGRGSAQGALDRGARNARCRKREA